MQNLVRSHVLSSLPVTRVVGDLAETLNKQTAAVLVAPPGSGKTTAVPLALLMAPWLNRNRILLLAPRRLAAVAAAERMATLLQETVGQTVGYRIRLESRVGVTTRIEVITEGILTRLLQSDPQLSGVGLVIFDEFHERSLDADLGLALCREVQSCLNTSLRLLVMSATLDPLPIATLLGDAPVFSCPGQLFEVETRYCPPLMAKSIERAVTDQILRSVTAAEGNILAFLPGAAEIRRVARWLSEVALPSNWLVAPLFGQLSRAQQNAAIAPPPEGYHKIVLATSIAETSLTIEQIQVVIDSGLQRAPRFDPRSGMTRLVTLPVSQASADQRRGRAGRLGPGICYRLWHMHTHAALPMRNRPEIVEADLSGLALELAVWGAPSTQMSWLDPPPDGAFEQAKKLLVGLGALDAMDRVTAHGRCMAQLPLHPRLAHMIVSAQAEGMGQTACDLAAILSERDPLHFESGQRDTDVQLRLDAVRAVRAKTQFPLTSGHMDTAALHRIAKISEVLQRHLGPTLDGAAPANAGRLLAWAYPDRIACRRSDEVGRYRMSNGKGAFFESVDPLGTQQWVVIAEVDGANPDARIHMAAAYDFDTLMEQYGQQMQWRAQVDWDDAREAVIAQRQLYFGSLMIRSEPLAKPDAQVLTEVMLARIVRQGLSILPWTEAVRTFQARVRILRQVSARQEEWPDLSDATLTETLSTWLAPHLIGLTSLKALSQLNLLPILHNHLSLRQQRLLDVLAPTHLIVPSGMRRSIDYRENIPVLAVRLQEMFGATQTPTIADGRLPVKLHLLSPAGRTVQITQDLSGFWRNSYSAVRKELKGRYPKHAWPEDPINAHPTARAKPRPA